MENLTINQILTMSLQALEKYESEIARSDALLEQLKSNNPTDGWNLGNEK